MNKQKIIEMARDAASHGVENHRSGEVSFVFYNEHLMNFAKLVAAKEREACAMACENIYTGEEGCGDWPTPEMCAVAIRARGEA